MNDNEWVFGHVCVGLHADCSYSIYSSFCMRVSYPPLWVDVNK